MFKKTLKILSPVLFALFPIVSLYSHNIGEVNLAETWRILLVVLAVSTTSQLLLWKFLRERSLIITPLLFLSFASFSQLDQLFQLLLTDYSNLTTIKQVHTIFFQVNLSHWIAIAILWLLNITCIAWIFRQKNISTQIVQFIQVFGLVLITIPLITTITTPQLAPTAIQPTNQPLIWNSSAPLPDIYYIILDAYGRDDLLQQLFDFDNTPFIQSLEQRGFYVARQSPSNYSQTPISLSSSLNMRYINDVATAAGTDEYSRSYYLDLIQHNQVMQLARNLGYTTISFDSGTNQTNASNVSDKVIRMPFDLTPIEREYINLTPLAVINQSFYQKIQYKLHAQKINFNLDQIKLIAQNPAATFTYAHILSPHAPFIFNADGTLRINSGLFSLQPQSSGLTKSQYSEGYTNQISYLNSRVIDIVDTILNQTNAPPIIIIQGDHGSDMTINWENPTPEQVNERMSILNAYLFPAADPAIFSPNLSPVNSFRLLFNTYFGGEYEMLPNHRYYTTYTHPYQYLEF